MLEISKDYEKQLLEKLADLEHNQWWEWSRDLSRKEKLSKERLDRWDRLWTFYKFLSEKSKEQDRVYARKIIDLLKQEQIIKTQDTESHISGGQSSANKRETGGDNATDLDKCEPMKQSIAEGIMSPKQKTGQIEKGENWIVEFWRVRGFEIVKTALGISFSLHRKPEFENRGLGLDLDYLEQFAEESIRRGLENAQDNKR